MKRLFLSLLTAHCSLFILLSQAPQGFNYQAVARNDAGELLISRAIDVKIGIRSGSGTGTLVWEEIHTVTTNDFGLFALMIGDPSAIRSGGSAATFPEIEWSSGAHFLETQIKVDAAYIPMGTSELLSVPYALFAEAGNEGPQGPVGPQGPQGDKGDPGDPATDDQTLSIVGHDLTISGGNTVTLPDDVNDADANPTNEIQDLSLAGNILSLTGDPTPVNLSIYLDNTNPWSKTGNNIWYNAGNVGIGTGTPASRLEVKGNISGLPADPLFEVKRKDGQTVFAVYEDSVRIYVNTAASAKGTKGGFAVGGFTPSKGLSQEYMRITPDSVRIYFDESLSGKGTKGGFAVGGFNPAVKGSPVSLLHLTKENYFIGHSSGINTTGFYNTFFGYESGRNNTSGDYNAFMGYQSGYNNISGDNNVFIGLRAGYSNNSGFDNTFIGNWSGYFNQSGSNNIIIGKLAGVSNLSNNNIFLGNESGRNNQSGNRNIYFGFKAGYASTAATNNVFIGDSAGYGAMSGYNICIGNSSGIKLTSGMNNVLIGREAGYKTTTASSTVVIGNKAGYHSNDDDGCVFIGNMAGYYNVNGDYNTLVGFYAGYNVTGNFNTYLGEASGFDFYSQNKTCNGNGNTILGYYSASEITTGQYNTTVGYTAGFGITTGTENVIIGKESGNNNTGGNNNVYLGTRSGYNSTGSGNLFLGYNAGYNEAGSNKLYIDNSSTASPLIYGDFSSDLLRFNGNVAISIDPNPGAAKFYAYDGSTSTNDIPAVFGEHDENTTGWGVGVKGLGGYRGVEGWSTVPGSGARCGLYGYATGGSTNYGVYGYGAGGTSYAGYFNGNVTVTGTLTYPSDLTFKKNIIPLDNALDKILTLRGVSYEWKSPAELPAPKSAEQGKEYFEDDFYNFPAGKQLGVIAQEVENVVPELVITDQNGLKSVDYIKMTPLLIEAIKEQQKMIEEQQVLIEKLQNRVDVLEKKY